MKQFVHTFMSIILVCCAARTVAAPSEISLHFIENKGQITDQYGASRGDIDGKLSAAKGLNIFLGSGGLHYQWAKPGNGQTDMCRMDVKLLGANPHAPFTIEERQSYHERYYLPSAVNAVAGTFRRMVYHNVYPHIDWVLYVSPGNGFKYDFVVRPGGNPSDIRLQYGGADRLALNDSHGLAAVTPLGSITEQDPYSYELQGGKKITSSYRLENNVLSFLVGAYDGTLVIDPGIAWGTYFGGNDYDDLSDVTVGKQGYVYATGSTNSVGNIATTGAYQTSFAGGSNSGGSDALLCKFDPQGQLIWATYYGGTDADLGKKLAVDTSGSIYIAGWAGSTSGIATSGSYQPVRAGGADRYNAFVVKFDTSGQRIWGTYCGGSNDANPANPLAICADKAGNICLAFTTESPDITTTTGAHQTTLNGYDNAFLAKFNGNGQLVWSTYYGGETADYPYAITTDLSDNIYVAGRSQSTGGMATSGAFQASNSGGQDAFLSKFASDGQLVWATYYGGSGLDRAYGVTIDSLGHVYLAGTTSSTTGMATPGSYQSALDGSDGFLVKFDTAGQRIWGTYYGGPGSESIWAVQALGNDRIYCTGQTSSASAMATPDGPQQVFGGSVDALAARFDSSGALAWGSYLGGQDGEIGFALSGDDQGHLYICGRTNSASGIASASGYQGSFAGGTYDGFLVRLNDCSIPTGTGLIDGPDAVCAGTIRTYAASFTGAALYHWDMPAGWSGSSQTDHISITFGEQSGVLKVSTENTCGASDTVAIHITVNPLPEIPLIIQNGDQLSVAAGYASYQWSRDGQPIAGANEATYVADNTGTYTVTVSNGQGCAATAMPVAITITDIGNPVSEKDIHVYPNPATTYVRIYLPESCNVSVRGLDGRLIRHQLLAKGTQTISLAGYASGLYLLQVYNAQGAFIGTVKISKTE